MKKALITGITGQDGSYLSELLLEKGYEVTGVTRERDAASPVSDRVILVEGDIGTKEFVDKRVAQHFDEIYNLASIATVAEPLKDIPEIERITAGAPLLFLEAIRTLSPETKFFQASSAEMYGGTLESPQNEMTPFAPVNPYGIAKLKAHRAVEEYRSKSVFAVSGILFNHESPRRPATFVTRNITSALARIALGADEVLRIGNLEHKRDWSYAGDVVRGMWQSLQVTEPSSYVFASGEVHTVRDFVNEAANMLGMSLTWEGSGLEEVGTSNGRTIVSINPAYFRKAEAHVRCGDASRARKILGWESKVSFSELVRMMVEADLQKLRS